MSKSVLSAGSLLILQRNARRIRSSADSARSQTLNELQMAQTNRVLEPEVDTTFLITSLEYAYLSSTVVKEVAAFGGDIHKFVPGFVEKEIRAKYAARNSEGMPQDKR